MITLDDLVVPGMSAPVQKAEGTPETSPVEEGSPLAKVLYQVVRGTPVTVVKSPPGAGKSTLVADLVRELAGSAATFASMDLRILVCAPSRAACIEIAKRMSDKTAPGTIRLSGSAFQDNGKGSVSVPDDLVRGDQYDQRVTVRTVASAMLAGQHYDVAIFDEAYQTTYAQVVAAADNADQIVLVGDPGQIGPVNALDVSPWGRMEFGPHSRAPEGFEGRRDAAVVTLPASFRLGQQTVDAISPLYDFPFISRRPDASLIGHAELESVVLPPTGHVADPQMVNAVVGRVQSIVSASVVSPSGLHQMSPEDVAVVVSRNEQRSIIAATLRSVGLPDVTVGTADSLQGGQWMAVVAVDPFLGTQTGSKHALSTGRLCVMTSRHVAHLTWVCSADWRDVIDASALDDVSREQHVRVREALTA